MPTLNLPYKTDNDMNIFIIGATSGIGYELWRHYVSKGDRVAVSGRRNDLLQAMEQEAPDNTLTYRNDIADIKSTTAMVESVWAQLGRIDLAIVCASVGELNPELNVDTELDTLSVNVLGWANLTGTLYNRFKHQGSGQLVAVTSVGGLQPTSTAPSYSASKAFQINYIKSLQQKSKRTNIRVTEIRPGLVDTRMAKGEGLFWVMPLDKVTELIIKAIVKKRRRAIITGRWRMINFLLKHFM